MKWEEIRRIHADAAAALVATAEKLAGEKWLTPRAVGKWTPAEIVEHLNLSYETMLRELAGGKGMQVRTKLWQRLLLRFTLVPKLLRGGKFPLGRAPRETRPAAPNPDPAPAIAAFREQSARFDAMAAEVMAGGRRRKLTHAYFGSASIPEAMLLCARHVQHHQKQLAELFPPETTSVNAAGRSLLVLAVVLLAPLATATSLDPNFTETAFVSIPGGDFITVIGWAPDGSNRLFVALKGGQLRIVKDGVLLTNPFATESVFTNSECGLIGIAFDPAFATNGYVYLFATISASEQQIIRYTADGDSGTNRTVILPGLPTRGQNHDGGAIGFGPDGMLYWAIGDLGNFTGVNDDLTSLAAKVGRAHPTGEAPADNPFFDGAGPNNDYIWARGFRNPFTATWRSETEEMWVNVVGTSFEQSFVVRGGDHAGYNIYENNQPSGFIRPVISYKTDSVQGLQRTIAAAGATRSGGVATFTTTESDHGYPAGTKVTISGVTDLSFNGTGYVTEVPALNMFRIAQAGLDATSGGGTATSLVIGRAMTGGAFLESTSVPAPYRGDFFFTDYITHRVVRADIGAGGTVAAVDYFAQNVSSAVDIDVGPDGNLYVAGLGGAIHRFAYNAVAQGIVVSRRFLRTTEGSEAVFNVRLAMPPDADVVVTVTRVAGDTNLSVAEGASLTFTSANWAVPQVVRIAVAQDPDPAVDAATFSVASAGLVAEDVVVRATPISIPPATPANFAATATSATTVALSWTASNGAAEYEIERSASGTNFQHRATTTATDYVDAAGASTAYLYRVKARNVAGDSPYSDADLATTVVFSDEPVVPQVTPVRAVHMAQLRTAVDAVRALAAEPSQTWTDDLLQAGLTPVRGVHVQQLRDALAAALSALELPALAPADPVLTTATPVRAIHVQELRDAVQ